MADHGLTSKISVVISGHMHWMQHLAFDPTTKLPSQVVVGNSGTKLIPKALDPEAISTMLVNATVEEGFSQNTSVTAAYNAVGFGYGAITSNENGLHTVDYVIASNDGTFGSMYRSEL